MDMEHPSPTFFHNPIHDLESLWWILCWFSFTKVAKRPNATGFTPSENQIYIQGDRACQLFPSHIGRWKARELAFTGSNGFRNSCLKGRFPEHIAPFGSHFADPIGLCI